MSEKEINFFCQQFNFYWSENKALPQKIKIFENKDLYEYDKQYIWFYSPKFKPEIMGKIEKGLKIAGFGILGLLIGIILMPSLLVDSNYEWIKRVGNVLSNWLYGGN